MPHIHIHIEPITLYLMFWLACIGAVLGSFFDCIAWRRAHGREILKGRSYCGACGHELGVRDLIPLFSFLLARGKCRYCGEKIPRETFVAELAGAFAFAALTYKYDFIPLLLAMWLVFAAILLLLALIDYGEHILPNALIAALVVSRVIFFLLIGETPARIPGILGTAIGVAGALLLVVLFMDRVLKKETMGGGDIKLVFALGFYLDWQQLLLTLFVSCVLGIAGALAAKKKDAGIAFGPYLAAAALLVVIFGDPLISWYSGLLV